MSYSKDFRKRTIEYRQAGHTLEETHEVFNVSISAIRKWEQLLEETGDLEKKELQRSFRKIDPEKLKEYVEEHPDAYQSEMAKEFGCSESGTQMSSPRHKNIYPLLRIISVLAWHKQTLFPDNSFFLNCTSRILVVFIAFFSQWGYTLIITKNLKGGITLCLMKSIR